MEAYSYMSAKKFKEAKEAAKAAVEAKLAAEREAREEEALEEEIVYSEETTGGHSMSETNSQNKRILTLSLIGISVAALIGVIVIIKNRK